MSIARFIAGCGAFLATFAGFAVMFAGCMRLGEMLSGPDAAYAKAVVIAAVAGEAIELQACKTVSILRRGRPAQTRPRR